MQLDSVDSSDLICEEGGNTLLCTSNMLQIDSCNFLLATTEFELRPIYMTINLIASNIYQ